MVLKRNIKVHVKGYLLSKQGPVCRIDFSTERSQSRVLWGKSDRLKPGQLVVLSSDGFRRECLVATVADRRLVGGLLPNIASGEDDNTPPRIDLLWANPKEAIINPTTSMVMLEAKIGFFESLRYSMTGLQHAARYEYVYHIRLCTFPILLFDIFLFSEEALL